MRSMVRTRKLLKYQFAMHNLALSIVKRLILKLMRSMLIKKNLQRRMKQ